MAEVAQWNLLQIAVIAVYPAWQSFRRIPSGMSLLAVYLFLFILCVPPVFIQLKLGNHQQRGIVGLLSKHLPIFKGVGLTLLIQLFLICVYMVPLVTHYGLYAFIAICQRPYVWGACDKPWNDLNACSPETSQHLGPVYNIAPSLPKPVQFAPEAQFFDREYLQISGNISDISGFAKWHFSEQLKDVGISILPLAMLTVWILIFLAIAFGGRVCGWILFVLGPGYLAVLFTTLGYGHSNLDKNGTFTFLQNLYTLDMDLFNDLHKESPLIQDWSAGFVLVMHSIPIWTAILPTMGKMTGNGRLSRNISWLLVVLVYAATCQLPQLTMAPYIGNLQQTVKDQKFSNVGFDVVFTTMAAAFARLEIPPVYALLFYLAVFIGGLMSLIVAMFTLLDNLVDAITDWSETFQEKRGCVNFCSAFVLISVGVGASILHTTQAGLYFIILMDQCVFKLYFITVAVYGICIIIVYGKQNFGIAERIIMCMWCAIATVTTTAIFLYCFITDINSVPGYRGVEIKGTWDLVCWVFASAPFLAIPAAMIHSCQQEDGSCLKKMKYLFCGTKQDQYDPPQEYGYHRPEPSAPPYGTSAPNTYTYMDESYPMEEVPYYKST